MAQPFSEKQITSIRSLLLSSAQRHALSTGLRKTSLDTLTADAGIAKSSFYKFFASKEDLFIEVAGRWEADILSAAVRTLEINAGQSSKRRAAEFVYAAFERMHQLGILRFLREDMPLLDRYACRRDARAHCMNSARIFFDALRDAQIRFTEPDDVVLCVIQMLYLSILNIADLGDNFLAALRILVESACDRLVA